MLTVALLGQLNVRLDGQPADLSLRPVQMLLAYLLLNQEVAHRRERLAGLLWPDYTEASARKNLRNTVYRLRKVIGHDYLLADRTTLAFNAASAFQLDVVQLEEESDPIVTPSMNCCANLPKKSWKRLGKRNKSGMATATTIWQQSLNE